MNAALTLSLFATSPLTLRKVPWSRLRVSVAYLWRHGYLPNLRAPTKYNEWVQWRKLYDRDLGLALLTDKLHAKSVAAERGCASLVIPTLWHGDRLPEESAWPMPFIVKANHGCGQFVVVRTAEDWRTARRISPTWLTSTYGKWLDEWHYGSARKSIIVEPFIGPAVGLPVDYKVYVFGGVARFVQVHLDRDGDHRWVQFDRNWRQLSRGRRGDDIAKPSTLPQMLAAAEQIAGSRDHLRVDFYEADGRLWFGETCLFPGSGLDPFDPPSLDDQFGRLWDSARATLSPSLHAPASPRTPTLSAPLSPPS